jgi:hypothetical protein
MTKVKVGIDLLSDECMGSPTREGKMVIEPEDVAGALRAPDPDTLVYLRRREMLCRPDAYYLRVLGAVGVSSLKRARYFSKMCGVAQCMVFSPRTIHVAFDLFDRYMSTFVEENTPPQTPFDDVYTTALTCLWLANKLEDPDPLSAPELPRPVYISVKDVLSKEVDILARLKYVLTNPLSYEFVSWIVLTFPDMDRGCRAKWEAETHRLLIAALTHSKIAFFSLVPSVLAVACAVLAAASPVVREAQEASGQEKLVREEVIAKCLDHPVDVIMSVTRLVSSNVPART